MIEVTDIKLKFGYIISSQSITNLQMDMGEIIAKRGLNTSRQDCQKILDIYNISSVSNCKKELLELSLFYIKIALIDNIISEDEMTNIRFLKLLFDINEGDFKSDTQMSDEISRIIKNQVDLMILNDRKIDEQEALQKIFLQEIFGLGYDEFAILTNQSAMKAVEDGSFWSDVDTYVSQNEINQWHKDRGSDYSTDSDNGDTDNRSRHITQQVKDDVWNRDNGKCVICGSNENLEFDHIIPFSEGGANTYRNIQLLCQPCNRSKSDSIG
jgi:hypothetical protein